ncbi:hypothetical protein LK540_03965 [Massilia sp. IC2-278]|uniref:hypothetical protein n=1 Tax=Massilia sp. IC2-278 TaxID=2887200 RepID=UPI001E4E7483|nr:hypothetical protein [Massilia sp. IC2-278]MCC2959583.1 hypothetical protein [Massilia sp. IC2-278]
MPAFIAKLHRASDNMRLPPGGRASRFRPGLPIPSLSIHRFMPRSVLLVESDQDLAETISGMLGALGYSVVVLGDQARALGIMHGIRFSLLVTTARDGTSAAAQFAREARLLLPDLKVLLITGAGYTAGLLSNAFDATLYKPFNVSQLLQVIAPLARTSGSSA